MICTPRRGQAENLFPDDSKTGDTATRCRSPSRRRRTCRQALGRRQAAAAAITDKASFKAQWPKVVTNCGGCHKEYRKRK